MRALVEIIHIDKDKNGTDLRSLRNVTSDGGSKRLFHMQQYILMSIGKVGPKQTKVIFTYSTHFVSTLLEFHDTLFPTPYQKRQRLNKGVIYH